MKHWIDKQREYCRKNAPQKSVCGNGTCGVLGECVNEVVQRGLRHNMSHGEQPLYGKSTWKMVKNPKPMDTVATTGATHNIPTGEVQPNMKSPPAKKTDPSIIGGRRASGTGLLPFAL